MTSDDFDGIAFTEAEKRVLLRLVNRAIVTPDLQRMVCIDPLERRALDWARDRLHSAIHVPRILPKEALR